MIGMGLKKEIVEANLIFTAGKIISIFIVFFFNIMLARLLQPYEFGIFSFALIVAGFFMIVSVSGFDNMLIRFVANYIGKGEYKKAACVIKIIFKYKVFLTLVPGFLILIFYNQIASFIFNKPEMGHIVLFSAFIIIIQSFFGFSSALFYGLKNIKMISYMQILENILKFIFAIGLALLGLKAVGAISGVILAYILIIVISTIIIYRKYGFIFSKIKTSIYKGSLLKFGILFFIADIIGNVYNTIDQVMVSIMQTVESVGFYKIAASWMFVIAALVPISGYVMYPYFSGSENKKILNLMVSNSLKYALIFAFPLTFLLSAFSKPIILFFYGEAFLPVVPVLTVLAFVSITMLIIGVLGYYFYGIGRPDIALKVTFLILILNVIFNYFLIQMYGIVGAAMATLISGIITVVIFLLIAILIQRLKFKFSIIWKPLIPCIIIYYLLSFFIITNIFEVIFYGLISLGLYAIIMILVGGIEKEDIKVFKDFVHRFI